MVFHGRDRDQLKNLKSCKRTLINYKNSTLSRRKKQTLFIFASCGAVFVSAFFFFFGLFYSISHLQGKKEVQKIIVCGRSDHHHITMSGPYRCFWTVEIWHFILVKVFILTVVSLLPHFLCGSSAANSFAQFSKLII